MNVINKYKNLINKYKNAYVKHMVDFIMNSNMNKDEKIAALDMLHDIDKQCINKEKTN